jgi:hypothetical protein
MKGVYKMRRRRRHRRGRIYRKGIERDEKEGKENVTKKPGWRNKDE